MLFGIACIAMSPSGCLEVSEDFGQREHAMQAVRRTGAGDDPTAMGLGNDDAGGRCRRRPSQRL